jgi:hypothetical protein
VAAHNPGTVQFSIRIPVPLDEAVEAEVEAEQRAKPGRTFTKADAIREALHQWVAARKAERESKQEA